MPSVNDQDKRESVRRGQNAGRSATLERLSTPKAESVPTTRAADQVGVRFASVHATPGGFRLLLAVPLEGLHIPELAKLHLVHDDTPSPAPLAEATPVWATGHDVQFYDGEEFLFEAVASFLTDGLRAGQPLVVIATEAHRRGFLDQLRPIYHDIDDRLHGSDIVWLDARETLAAFMEGPTPNPELFEVTVGNVFEKVMADRSYLVVRAYGEMVDLLWKDGNIEGAIALEELWNGLARKYSFNLLCAYSMGNFFKEAHRSEEH